MEKQAEYEKKLIDYIKKYKCYKWAYIDWDMAGFSRSTAYSYELNELDTIKEALHDNCKRANVSQINTWLQSDNPTLQIAAFKILASDEDRQKLNQAYVDHTSDGKPLSVAISFVAPNETEDQ